MNHAALDVEKDLSSRDRAILQSLAMHRYLPAQYVERLHFYGHASRATASRSCRRVMERLWRNKLIHRLPDRRVGGVYPGSTAYIYCLSRHGQKVSHTSLGNIAGISNEFASPLFVDHIIEIAHTHVRLTEAMRRSSLQLLTVQTEPSNWRSFTNAYGLPEKLKPDLYVATSASTDDVYEDVWFVEVDRATESTAVLRRKCLQYINYRISGQSAPGAFPLVIWLVPHSQRYHQLRAVVESLPVVHQALFRVLLQPRFVPFIRARYFLGRLPY